MDRPDSVATLLAAVGGGSLSAALRPLGIPLATVSRTVSELEGRLRSRLIVRTSRKLSLTEAARARVGACRRILGQVDEAERAAGGEYRTPQGDLTVVAPIVLLRLHVVPVVLAFLQVYPDVDVRPVRADHVLDRIDERVDVAVRIGELPDSSLVALHLGSICRMTCASPAGPAACGTAGARGSAQPRPHQVRRPVFAPGLDFRERAENHLHGHARPLRRQYRRGRARRGPGIARVLSCQAASAVREGALTLVLPALKLRTFLDVAAPRRKASAAEPAGPACKDR